MSDEIEIVDEKDWSKLEPNYLIKIFLTVFYSLILVTGIVGNAVTIRVTQVLKRNGYLQKNVTDHMVSLACSDLLVLLIGMPVELYSAIWFPFTSESGNAACKIYNFLFEACSYATILNVATLSFERYIAICHPFRFKALGGKRTSGLITFAWLVSVLVALPLLVATGTQGHIPFLQDTPVQNLTFCTNLREHWVMYRVSIFVTFIIYMIVLICVAFMCRAMILVLKKPLGDVDRGTKGTQLSPRHESSKVKTARKQTIIFLDSRKAMVDEALVGMIIKDSQPFSIVEDVGFREFVHTLDPNYLLPSRKALKVMVDTRYREAKERAKEQVQKAAAVSLTSDMWTSINMDAYLAVTCHYINEDQLCTSLLGVQHFPKAHTAENLAAGHLHLMEEWGITDKVKCLVTDGAANMNACVRQLNIRHTVCVAHTINLIVKKSFEDVPALTELRQKCRKLVTLFRTSCTAKERLVQVQEQMARQPYKMVIEVDTRWNSTFHMFQRLYELREPVGAALASLKTDITPPTASEYDIIKDALQILDPFNQATVEVSAEKRVSGSKVIPLMKMLHHTVSGKLQTLVPSNTVRQLGNHLVQRLKDHIFNIESVGALTMPTLLDPRFKQLGFLSPAKTQEAVNRLKNECATMIRRESAATSCDVQQAVPVDQSASSGLIVGSLMVCWLPNQIRRLMMAAVPKSRWTTAYLHSYITLHPVADTFFYLSSVLNPFLYNLSSKQFREVFVQVLRCHLTIEHINKRTVQGSRAASARSLQPLLFKSMRRNRADCSTMAKNNPPTTFTTFQQQSDSGVASNSEKTHSKTEESDLILQPKTDTPSETEV